MLVSNADALRTNLSRVVDNKELRISGVHIHFQFSYMLGTSNK
jgi:hypothetical protein